MAGWRWHVVSMPRLLGTAHPSRCAGRGGSRRHWCRQPCSLPHLSEAYTRTSSREMRRRPAPRMIFQLSITCRRTGGAQPNGPGVAAAEAWLSWHGTCSWQRSSQPPRKCKQKPVLHSSGSSRAPQHQHQRQPPSAERWQQAHGLAPRDAAALRVYALDVLALAPHLPHCRQAAALQGKGSTGVRALLSVVAAAALPAMSAVLPQGATCTGRTLHQQCPGRPHLEGGVEALVGLLHCQPGIKAAPPAGAGGRPQAALRMQATLRHARGRQSSAGRSPAGAAQHAHLPPCSPPRPASLQRVAQLRRQLIVLALHGRLQLRLQAGQRHLVPAVHRRLQLRRPAAAAAAAAAARGLRCGSQGSPAALRPWRPPGCALATGWLPASMGQTIAAALDPRSKDIKLHGKGPQHGCRHAGGGRRLPPLTWAVRRGPAAALPGVACGWFCILGPRRAPRRCRRAT